jgi:hypothetical protein
MVMAIARLPFVFAGVYGTSATIPSGADADALPNDAKVYKTGTTAGDIVGWIKTEGVWQAFGVIEAP